MKIPEERGGILDAREDERRVLHEDDVHELHVHDFPDLGVERGHDAAQPLGLDGTLGEAGHEPLRDEGRDGIALALEEAEDQERALARRGRLGRRARPLGVAQALEERDEQGGEGTPMRGLGQASEYAAERLLRLLVEDGPQVLAKQDAEVGVLPERSHHDPPEGEIGLERDERCPRKLVENLRKIVELLDDEGQLGLGIPSAPPGRHLAAARPRDLAVEIEQKRREIFLAFPEELGGQHRHVGHPGAHGCHLFDVILQGSVRPFECGKRKAVDLEEALETLQPHLHLEQVVVLDAAREQSRGLEDREAGHAPL